MGVDQERIMKITTSIISLIDPEKIILFGSQARGDADVDSDIDLLIIDDSGRDKSAVSLEISRALFPRDYSLDLLIESPEGLKQKLELEFWHNAFTFGRVLYERE